jgi:four helix bundle protein
MERRHVTPGFEELEAYQASRALRQRIGKLVRRLPEDERYNLASQMRRAALSATNCIAEGHGSRSYRHNISYLYRSRGSPYELIDDLNAREDEGYFKPEHLADLRDDINRVIMLINGYIRYLKTRLHESTE